MCICVIFILDEYGIIKMRAIDQRKNLQKNMSHKIELKKIESLPPLWLLEVYLDSKVGSLPPLCMDTSTTRSIPGE